MSTPGEFAALPRRWPRWTIAVVLVAFGTLAWLSKVHVGVPLTDGRTDAGWCWIMADALLHGRQFGPDVVWSYGPISGLTCGLWVGELEPARMYAWEVGFKLLAALVVVAVTVRLSGVWNRILFALTYVVLPSDGGAWSLLTLLTVSTLLFDHIDARWAQWLGPFPLATLALEKVTCFALAAVIVAGLALALLVERDRRGAARWLAAYAGWLATVWLCCGQSLWNFPMWVSRSLELASGHSEAMSLDPSAEIARSGFVSLALAAAAALACVACGSRKPRQLARVAVWLAGVFTAYKAGYVRGTDHPSVYFVTAASLAYLLVEGTPARAWPRRILAVLRHSMALHAVVVCTALFQGGGNTIGTHLVALRQRMSYSAARLLDAALLREECEAAFETGRKRAELPRIRARVGATPLDVVPAQQGVAALNGLTLSIRPVIHSYSTFTPGLAAINARFFEDARAPHFVMLELFSLDGRVTLADDARALEVLARDYVPVVCEGDDLLLERLPDAPRRTDMARVTSVERTITFGEPVDLSSVEGRCHVLALDVRYSLAGRVRTFLDRAPAIHAVVALSDGSKLRRRIVPGMVRGGFIADPWIHSNGDWLRWRSSESVARLVSIEIERPPCPWMYSETIGLRYVEAPDLVPDPALPAPPPPCEAWTETLPARSRPAGAGHRVDFPDLHALAVATPSALVFELPAGRLRLECFHGLLPRSYTKRESDGAGFSAVLVRDGVELTTLYRRVLDPRHQESDRGHVRVDVEFDVDAPCELELRTDGGPAGDTRDDWTYWGGARITASDGNILLGGSAAPR